MRVIVLAFAATIAATPVAADYLVKEVAASTSADVPRP